MVKVELNVDDEFKAAGDALAILIVDIVAKKSITQIAADSLPLLFQAVGGFSAMGVDIKKVDNQVYLAKCLADALEPKPA